MKLLGMLLLSSGIAGAQMPQWPLQTPGFTPPGAMSTAPSPRFDAYVGQTKTRVRQVSVPWLHERMERKDVYFVIDVREDSEWTQGHVPGAFHISKGVLERFIEALAPDTGQEIIVYCNTGSRSALAADSLQRMGYSNILSVDGGFRAWVVAGYPTE